VAERISEVRSRIARAAERAGRSPDAVTLIAVTKGHPAHVAEEALAAGVRDLGEDRVPELAAKAAAVAGVRWHMIGQLQSNKVRSLPEPVAAIHSVDRSSLVRRLADRYAGHSAPPQLFLEVNVAGEEAKAGIDAGGLPDLLAEVRAQGLTTAGLMTIAPLAADAEAARPVFAALARLAAECGLPGLSMGMTNDFEVAVEEGATHVRVGRALFGPRTTGPAV
jgi:pyridoxal phosphate enzyme (YggS family)